MNEMSRFSISRKAKAPPRISPTLCECPHVRWLCVCVCRGPAGASTLHKQVFDIVRAFEMLCPRSLASSQPRSLRACGGHTVRCDSHVACAPLRGMPVKSVATALLCGCACERKICVKFDYCLNSDTHTRHHNQRTGQAHTHTHTHTLSLSLSFSLASSLHRHPNAITLSSHIVLLAHCFSCVQSVSLLARHNTLSLLLALRSFGLGSQRC